MPAWVDAYLSLSKAEKRHHDAQFPDDAKECVAGNWVDWYAQVCEAARRKAERRATAAAAGGGFGVAVRVV